MVNRLAESGVPYPRGSVMTIPFNPRGTLMRGEFRAAILASAVSAALILFGLAPANAAVPLPGVVSATPVSWTPNVFAGTTDSTVCQQWFGSSCSNATVYSTAVVNGEVVVVGAFTQACQPGPSSSGHCQPGT